MHNIVNFLNSDQFEFIVLPTTNPDPQYLSHYKNAYDCWLKVWEDTYKELGITKRLHSDEFTRHNHMNCIFFGSQLVAMVHSRILDLSLPTTRDDSYFRLWSDEDIAAVKKHGETIMVISNMTVNPAWRKEHFEVSTKDLIIYLCCRRFATSHASAMATFTRNTKNIHKLVERFGAQVIRENVINFNEADLVNLFVFTKDSVSEGTKDDVRDLGRKLWEKRLIIPQNFEPEVAPTKKSA